MRAEEERPGPGGEEGGLTGPGVPPESGGETPGFPAQPDPEQLIYLHISYHSKQAFWHTSLTTGKIREFSNLEHFGLIFKPFPVSEKPALSFRNSSLRIWI